MKKDGDTQNKEIKSKDGHEESRVRAYFVRLFDKYHIRDEQQFNNFIKWTIFLLLLLVEAFILAQHIYNFAVNGGWVNLFIIVLTETVLSVSEGLKLFVVKKGKLRGVFYALAALCACVFMFVTTGNYPVIIYMLVLTELYTGTKGVLPSVMELVVAVLLYEVSYIFQAYVLMPDGVMPDVVKMIIQSFGNVITLLGHFVIVQVVLAFYRQFCKLDKALTELDDSKKELEKAYAVLAEVTALEERQRIAKEIHDTAGHSLTTVIMQTEAAKLIIATNPEEAKNKIVAANLQAKHALEELRNSVHLLSGAKEQQTLKMSLAQIIRESTDGTGIVIRSEIQEIQTSPEYTRFLCNTLKEGISNGLRHGGATAFWFECKEENGEIRFLLSDNGKGVEDGKMREGFGLSRMRRRVETLGGQMHIESESGEGFELRLSLPQSQQ